MWNKGYPELTQIHMEKYAKIHLNGIQKHLWMGTEVNFKTASQPVCIIY